MKFTKEEVSLCKQVAEIYIKPMEYGDWWISEDWWKNTKKEPLLCSMKKWIPSKDVVKQGNFPLWTISDCLAFLNEKKFVFDSIKGSDTILGKPYVAKFYNWNCFLTRKRWVRGNSDTILEACLKAVLVVLEEKK